MLRGSAWWLAVPSPYHMLGQLEEATFTISVNIRHHTSVRVLVVYTRTVANFAIKVDISIMFQQPSMLSSQRRRSSPFRSMPLFKHRTSCISQMVTVGNLVVDIPVLIRVVISGA